MFIFLIVLKRSANWKCLFSWLSLNNQRYQPSASKETPFGGTVKDLTFPLQILDRWTTCASFLVYLCWSDYRSSRSVSNLYEPTCSLNKHLVSHWSYFLKFPPVNRIYHNKIPSQFWWFKVKLLQPKRISQKFHRLTTLHSLLELFLLELS